MTRLAGQTGFADRRDPLSWGKTAAGFLALGLSGGLHYAVIDRFPDVPVGQVPEWAVVDPTQSVQLREIRRSPSDAWERPAKFQAQDPARQVDLVSSTVDSLHDFTPRLVQPEPLKTMELAGEAGALAEPDRHVERDRWEPRLERLQIQDEIHTGEEFPMPRRYTVPRMAGPVTPLLELRDKLEDSDVLLQLDSMAPATGIGMPVELTVHGSNQEWLPVPKVSFSDGHGEESIPGMSRTGDRLGLHPEEAAPFEAVEQLLALDLLTYRPPDEPNTTYFQVEIRRKSAAEMPVLPKDVLIVQDCSESMTRRKLDACKRGLHKIVGQLNEQDRLDILGFRESTYRCFRRFRFATSTTKAQANLFIEEMEARGGTDVFACLQVLSSLEKETGRPILVVLVTDGRPTKGMVDSSDIIEAFTRSNRGQISVFTVGGGKRVNRFLLDLLSYRNRGESQVVEKRNRIPTALDELSRGLARPVLRDLSVRFSGVEGAEVYPHTLTHLYLDRPLVMYGRVERATAASAFQIVGESKTGAKDMVFPVEWEKGSQGSDRIRTRWAWHKIYYLIGQYIETDRQDVLDEIHRVADRFGLRVPYGRDVVFF